MRIGFGYDIHRLVKGRKLMIGGVAVPFEMGEKGHSDGDVLIHALIDALLGAAGAGDIGLHFPPGDPAWKDAPGSTLLEITMGIVKSRGFTCRQIDSVVILEKPKLSPFRETIRDSLKQMITDTPLDAISIKAKTKEGCGEVGAGKAIEAYVVVLLENL